MKDKYRIYLSIKVRPRAGKRQVEKISSSEYKVSVLSPPTKGKANREVVEVLASYFGLSLSQVKILRGEKSRQKLILLEVDNKNVLALKDKESHL